MSASRVYRFLHQLEWFIGETSLLIYRSAICYFPRYAILVVSQYKNPRLAFATSIITYGCCAHDNWTLKLYVSHAPMYN